MAKSFFPSPEVLATLPLPNYVDPETRGRYTIITAIICAVLSTIAVILRLIARLKIKKGLGWDDFWIVLGLIFSNIFFANIFLAIKVWGWDHHIWDIPTHLKKPAAVVHMSGIVLFIISTSSTRTSLLCFYLRLIRDAGSPRWQYAIYGFFGMTIMASVAFGLTAILRCQPIYAYWVDVDQWTKGAHCFDDAFDVMMGGCVVVFADFAAMLLPLPVVLRLQMPIRQRISVAVLLSLGLIVIFVSSGRTYFLWKDATTYDTTWESHPLWICSSVEILILIICTCLPATKPLYDEFCNWIVKRKTDSMSSRNLHDATGIPATHPPAVVFRTEKKADMMDIYQLSNYTSTSGNMTPMEEFPEAAVDSAPWLDRRKPSGKASSHSANRSLYADSGLESVERSGSSGTVITSVQSEVNKR